MPAAGWGFLAPFAVAVAVAVAFWSVSAGWPEASWRISGGASRPSARRIACCLAVSAGRLAPSPAGPVKVPTCNGRVRRGGRATSRWCGSRRSGISSSASQQSSTCARIRSCLRWRRAGGRRCSSCGARARSIVVRRRKNEQRHPDRHRRPVRRADPLDPRNVPPKPTAAAQPPDRRPHRMPHRRADPDAATTTADRAA